MTDQWLDCTGNVVVGDVVRFTEAVFGGSFRKPTHLGERTITARVVRDSYGSDRQQHTFSLDVVRADGFDASKLKPSIRRKGRNVYRNGCVRQRWDDEASREVVCREKWSRGRVARADRAARVGL